MLIPTQSYSDDLQQVATKHSKYHDVIGGSENGEKLLHNWYYFHLDQIYGFNLCYLENTQE